MFDLFLAVVAGAIGGSATDLFFRWRRLRELRRLRSHLDELFEETKETRMFARRPGPEA